MNQSDTLIRPSISENGSLRVHKIPDSHNESDTNRLFTVTNSNGKRDTYLESRLLKLKLIYPCYDPITFDTRGRRDVDEDAIIAEITINKDNKLIFKKNRTRFADLHKIKIEINGQEVKRSDDVHFNEEKEYEIKFDDKVMYRINIRNRTPSN